MLEHGIDEYNKDFPRLKITLYEVKFPFRCIFCLSALFTMTGYINAEGFSRKF